MTGKDDAAYSGPLSPEEKAECDRELEEMRRLNFEQLDRDIDEDIQRSIDRRIEQRIEQRIERSIERKIEDRIFSVMD